MIGLKSHIRQHRARVELTQQDLAKRVGVSRQTIISIEKGRYVPSTLLALKIARVLEMKVEDLFELTEDSDD
jgi:putative transcriptional regulator